MPDFDQLYKRLVKNFFKWHLAFFCAEIAEKIDFKAGFEFIDKELYTDQIQGKKRFTDVLAKVKLLSGEVTYIFIHIEIQRGKKHNLTLRMFNYYKVITLEHNLPVFALAIYIGRKSKKEVLDNVFEEKCFGTNIRYEYQLRNLKDYDYKKHLDHDNPIVAALLCHMDHGKDSKALVIAIALKKLSSYNLSDKQNAVIINFIEQMLRLNDVEKDEFKEYINQKEYKEAKKMISGYDEIFGEYREKWEKKGVKREKIAIAKKMKSKGMKRADIAAITGLSTSYISKLPKM